MGFVEDRVERAADGHGRRHKTSSSGTYSDDWSHCYVWSVYYG